MIWLFEWIWNLLCQSTSGIIIFNDAFREFTESESNVLLQYHPHIQYLWRTCDTHKGFVITCIMNVLTSHFNCDEHFVEAMWCIYVISLFPRGDWFAFFIPNCLIYRKNTSKLPWFTKKASCSIASFEIFMKMRNMHMIGALMYLILNHNMPIFACTLRLTTPIEI